MNLAKRMQGYVLGEGIEHHQASLLVQHEGLTRLRDKYEPLSAERYYHNLNHGIKCLTEIGISAPIAVREGLLSTRNAINLGTVAVWHDDEVTLGPILNEKKSAINVGISMERHGVSDLDIDYVQDTIEGSTVTIEPGNFKQWANEDDYGSILFDDVDVALLGAEFPVFLRQSAIPLFTELHNKVTGNERRDAAHDFMKSEIDILRNHTWYTKIIGQRYPNQKSNADIIMSRLTSPSQRHELLYEVTTA